MKHTKLIAIVLCMALLAGCAGTSSTVAPTQRPTSTPTEKPTETPTKEPTLSPTQEPTNTPSNTETPEPTKEPTNTPTEVPATAMPTPPEDLTPTATPEPTSTLTPTATTAPTNTSTPTTEPTKPANPTVAPTPTLAPFQGGNNQVFRVASVDEVSLSKAEIESNIKSAARNISDYIGSNEIETAIFRDMAVNDSDYTILKDITGKIDTYVKYNPGVSAPVYNKTYNHTVGEKNYTITMLTTGVAAKNDEKVTDIADYNKGSVIDIDIILADSGFNFKEGTPENPVSPVFKHDYRLDEVIREYNVTNVNSTYYRIDKISDVVNAGLVSRTYSDYRQNIIIPAGCDIRPNEETPNVVIGNDRYIVFWFDSINSAFVIDNPENTVFVAVDSSESYNDFIKKDLTIVVCEGVTDLYNNFYSVNNELFGDTLGRFNCVTDLYLPSTLKNLHTRCFDNFSFSYKFTDCDTQTFIAMPTSKESNAYYTNIFLTNAKVHNFNINNYNIDLFAVTDPYCAIRSLNYNKDVRHWCDTHECVYYYATYHVDEECVKYELHKTTKLTDNKDVVKANFDFAFINGSLVDTLYDSNIDKNDVFLLYMEKSINSTFNITNCCMLPHSSYGMAQGGWIFQYERSQKVGVSHTGSAFQFGYWTESLLNFMLK